MHALRRARNNLGGNWQVKVPLARHGMFMPKIVFLFIPKPGPCYELNTTCQWVAKDPGPKPGNCFELNADCKWIPKDKPPKPDGCFEFDEATCEWVEKEPPLNPNPSYPCWEYDEATCNWIEKDPGPNPGPCYAINGDCKWVEMPKNCWEIISVGTASKTECGACAFGCAHSVEMYPFDIAVKSCTGVADIGYIPYGQVVAKATPCERVHEIKVG